LTFYFLLNLSLALFEAGILLVDDKQLAFSLHDLAINAAFFNGSSNFHCLFFYLVPASAFRISHPAFSFKLFITENDPSPAQIVRTHFNPHFITRQNPDVVHPHFA
jgi:hypothetical protein